MPFERIMAAWAFLSLLPLILLYLRKPKPTEQTIPSLMFFMREKGITRFHSFFRHLFRNFLFLIQLLILSTLSFSLMGFFVEIPGELAGNTAIVLDISSSMKTQQDGQERFDRAVDIAREHLGSKTSLILAADVPRIAAENAASGEVDALLNTLEPADTTSNLGDAILVAKDILGQRGDLIVISDFIATEGIDPIVAKRAVSRGIKVEFFNVGGKASNAGIIDLDVGRITSEVTIKNFDDEERDVPVKLVQDGRVIDQATIPVLARSLEQFSFDTLPGNTEVQLDINDDFAADNAAYVSVPQDLRSRVLLITNEQGSNLEAALKAAPDIELSIAHPPVVEDFDFEVIIMHQVDLELMLPGYYRSMQRAAEQGGIVIITGQSDLSQADIDFLPVEVRDIGKNSQNRVNISNYYTEGIEFGVNEQYLIATEKEGSTTLVTAAGSPILTIAPLDDGTVVYYGILDPYSNFKGSITYPQFWSRLINSLTNKEDVSNFNIKTGRIEVIPNQNVDTPQGSLTTNRVLHDHNGYYTYDGRTVAVNLLSEDESDVSTDAAAFTQEANLVETEKTQTPVKQHFDTILALTAAALILLELLYIKRRGDL